MPFFFYVGLDGFYRCKGHIQMAANIGFLKNASGIKQLNSDPHTTPPILPAFTIIMMQLAS